MAESVHELERLAVLRQYQILDTAPEQAFDELALLASQICHTPIALIAFVDERRQWNKSAVGWPAAETAIGESFCAATLRHQDLLEVRDLAEDERFKHHAAVSGGDGIRFYAGMPLVMGAFAIGTLCVMDRRPRTLDPEQAQALRVLAKQVQAQLEMRRNIKELHHQHEETTVALRRSELFYHSLVESLPQNIFRKDLQGKFTFANSRFCGTVRRPISEIIGKTDYDFYPPELADKYKKDDGEVVRLRKTIQTLEAHQTSSQGIAYVHVIKSPIYDAAGEVCGIQGIFWDETERHKVQEALRHERNLLRAMLETIPDHIYYKDSLSRFLLCSRSLALSLGLEDPEAAIGLTDFDLFDEEHALAALEDEREIMRTGRPMTAKSEEEVWKNGSRRWVLTTKVPLRDPGGEIVGTFGISRDITEMKRVEAELASARDTALESARLKSEFLANMSHEIRTPMNAILGMTGLALETDLTDEQKDFLETIEVSAEALLNVINDILDFSKIEAGKLAVEQIDLELTDAVEGALHLLAGQAQAKSVELAGWIEPEIPRLLRGDPGRLRQILTNLVGNAVKFTPSGEVVLRVSLESESERDATLRFTVQDTGIGIPYPAQSRIFEPFTQADGSTTRRYGGTGLGLAIARQLVELMGGTIGFESEEGVGSTFWFRLCLEKQASQIKSEPSAKETLKGRRVLIVDDNRTHRRILSSQTASWGMVPSDAADGAAALAALRSASVRREPFEVAIIDMQMPSMDGLMLAREIGRDPSISPPKLLLLTSLGSIPFEQSCREAGIAASLVKPVKQARLWQALVSILGALPAPGQPDGRPVPEPGRPEGKPLRVLVAEDNSVNQKVALRQLRKLGHHATAVANGLEALDELLKTDYDIVLMDCQMPEMDGYEATRRIRLHESQSESLNPRWIVAMTANALAGDREKCLEAGMDDYVCKPVRVDELRAAMERAESAKKARDFPKESPSVDLEVISQLRELSTDEDPFPLREIVRMFSEDSPLRIDQLETGLREGNARLVEAAAHSLKGSAGNLGAKPLASLCGEVETLARKQDLSESQKLLEKIRKEHQLVLGILEQEILKKF